MKGKLLKSAFFGLGILCLIVFIMVRFNRFSKAILSSKHDLYGGLYNMTLIKNFREILPAKLDQRNAAGQYAGYRESTKHPAINQADILTFGDSFFFFPHHITFPERLSDTLNQKVFYENEINPFKTLKEKGYKKGQLKYLIYEIGERVTPGTFHSKLEIDPQISSNGFNNQFFKTLNTEDAEIRYTKILQQNHITSELYSLIATFKFNALGYVSKYTPMYNESSKFLFFYQTVNDKRTSYFYSHSNDELDNICDNIEYLADQLLSIYNLELILLPIPSKVTIYDSELKLDEYNNFLPEIYKRLKSRNVKFIDLYTPFRESDDLLFHPTDTHWNKNGIDLGLEITLHSMFSDNLVNTR